MSENPVENPPIETLTPREKQEQERAVQLAEVEQFLAEVAGQGYQLAIHRVEPRWCAGYLDTWELGEPLSMSAIRDEYGGKRFRLRVFGEGGGYLKSFTIRIDAAPLRDGVPVVPGPPPAPPAPVAPLPPPPKEDHFIGEIFKMMREQNQQITALFGRLATPAPVIASAPPANPLDAIKQIAGAVQVLREAAGEFAVPAEDTSSMMMMKFMEMLNSKQQADAKRALPPAKTRQRPQPGPRRGPPGPMAPPDKQQPQDAAETLPEPIPNLAPAAHLEPVPNPQEPPILESDPDEEVPLEEDMIAVGPEESGRAVQAALEGWSPSEQKKFLETVLGQEVPVDSMEALVAQSKDGGQDPNH